MQYKKISDFPNITTVGSGVYLPAVDPSESLAINQNKKIRVADFIDNYQGFKQSGTGAVSRTVTSKLRDVVSVKDFGAVGDGVTDDAPAFQSFLNYLATSATKANGYIPKGTYLLNSRVTYSGTNIRFGLYGDGVGLSQILVNNANGGISVQASDRNTEISIYSLEFIANRTPNLTSGIGLAINQPAGGNRHNRSAVIRDVKFSVVNDTNSTTYGYWSTACDLTGCWRPYVVNLIVSGVFGPGNSDNKNDTSPQYKTNIGLNVDSCYGPEIYHSYIWSCVTGISVRSSITGVEEAVSVKDTKIVGVKTGIDVYRPAREPYLMCIDNHINCRDYGIKIDGFRLAWIKTCLMYNEDTLNLGIANPTDIYLNNIEKLNIYDNIFHFDGPAGRRNIHALTGTIRELDISRNLFNTIGDSAIRIDSGATSVYIDRNQITGVYSNPIVDATNNAEITELYSIDSGTWTPSLTFGGGSTGITYSKQEGYWEISGRVMFFVILITLTNKGSSTGNAEISLPSGTVLPGNVIPTSSNGGVEFPLYSGMSLSTTPKGRILSATQIRLVQDGASAISNLTDVNFTNTSNIEISGWVRLRTP